MREEITSIKPTIGDNIIEEWDDGKNHHSVYIDAVTQQTRHYIGPSQNTDNNRDLDENEYTEDGIEDENEDQEDDGEVSEAGDDDDDGGESEGDETENDTEENGENPDSDGPKNEIEGSESDNDLGERVDGEPSEPVTKGTVEGAAEGEVEAIAEATAEAGAEAVAETAAAGTGEAAAGSTAEFWIPALIIIVVLVQVVVFAMAFMGYGDANTPSIYPAGGTVARGKGYSLQDNTDYSGTPCAADSVDNGTYTHPTRGFTIRLCNTDLGQVASINSKNIVALIAAAKRDGLNFGGGSFRSYEEQIALRKANCPNWETSRASDCTPPTAMPGSSMHERGLATDFKYNGTIINSRSNAGYVWLSNNASGFGYYNLPSEPWHWSTSGG